MAIAELNQLHDASYHHFMNSSASYPVAQAAAPHLFPQYSHAYSPASWEAAEGAVFVISKLQALDSVVAVDARFLAPAAAPRTHFRCLRLAQCPK
jgi:hypothetical protein